MTGNPPSSGRGVGDAFLNGAEEEFAVGADGGDGPAGADASVDDEILARNHARGVAGEEQGGLSDVFGLGHALQGLPSVHDRGDGGFGVFRMVVGFVR